MSQSTTGSGFSLKDQLFNRDRIDFLSGLFQASDCNFDGKAFTRQCMHGLKDLELKQRIAHIAVVLEKHLAVDFPTAAKQIREALPPPLDPQLADNDFGDFILAPLGEYVVRNGLERKHLRNSLKTLKAITMRFSMEDSIRAFLDAHPESTLTELSQWSTDSNYHVRRLVSEGTRPKLPWSRRLSIDVTTPLPFLDTLHADATRYVTRSVANHLNDISKSHPELVLQTLRNWKSAEKQSPQELDWINRHALRTLIKQGHSPALKFLGYRHDPKIEVSDFELKKAELQPGDTIEFSFSITAKRSEALMIDYVIDFVKANGTTAPKVHKLKSLSVNKAEVIALTKRHRLHANATTYKLYPGRHAITLQINGKPYGRRSFELLEDT
ncbi:DNA alkylation repair enzyme [Rhodopirellula islandica]|uniref:DNA alkylation repair enzyme n=1 Tax=Rhodopirellula islandica TaxID=595434 RepID=A0A0J1B8C2_RHOIS|nr:heat domain containing protein [Rhodopirellula islandica]KLU03075.1 DNA alkylation repair enzyme [Rhodopirellula islandica]